MRYLDALQAIADRAVRVITERFPGHPLLVIVNRSAGTAARHRRLRRVVSQLPPLKPLSGSLQESASATIIWTDSVAILRESIQQWFQKLPAGHSAPIVVSIGGDGTHNQVFQAGRAVSEQIWYYRLPVGSGNDAVPDTSVVEALQALDHPCAPQWIPAVEVVTRRARYEAFNIASVGIDAFVTAMHQRWRRRLPGNTYRLIANVALLLYEPLVRLAPMTIVVRNDGSAPEVLVTAPQRVMLAAFGAGGNRTYGDHIRILPDRRNICVITHAGLLRKLAMKRLLFHGSHPEQRETLMAEGMEMELHYDRSLPLQVDGEAAWLQPEDYPVTIRVVPRAARILEPLRVAQEAGESGMEFVVG
jgi:diacylglycerol kinase family enzyme